MRLEELVNRNYNQLNENDLRIWNYITAHRKECEMLSIDDLANKCHVSRTTILRFSKRIGLKGYVELKVYLRMDNELFQNKQTGLEFVYKTYIDYIKEMKEKDFTRILKMIDHAQNAYVYGTGSMQDNAALELKRSFLEVGKLFFYIQSKDETDAFVDVIHHCDIIVMISYSGENEQILNFAKKLKVKSVPIISITATQNNTLAHMADESLHVEVPSIFNPLGPRHEGLVNYFVLIDFILMKYIDYKERQA